ncbi:molybdenum cofactor biosynthesis protein MoaE [Alteromonas sediminis]|uniref:Molybdopterin synthase catalytic subunit n=1 Tax=Alteromonas sediminis TaxID=2259342 RepID=A0A3N5Z8D5_9ALTE|nr:molybdenum cofactor biosynthesis protein MoaE [Alteromonas sediminis]RPJ67084.1 molybdenum cofactor biosynthesis protein MoaE [Alteromonas sediminis]
MVVATIQFEPLNIGQLQAQLFEQTKGAGACVCFTGSVRDYNKHGAIEGIELEHYPGMTEKALLALAASTQKKFNCDGVAIVHRVGKVLNHEPIVWVGTASAHREAAFNAAMYAMDALKQSVPLWKREWSGQHATWVDSKAADVKAFERWQTSVEDE